MLRSLLLQQLHGLLDVPRAALQGSARLLRLEAHVDQHVQRRRLQEQLGRRVEVAATALQRSATGGHVVAAELPFARLCRRRFRLLFDGFPLIFLGFQGESSPFRRLQRVSRASDSCCACSMALSSPLLLDLCLDMQSPACSEPLPACLVGFEARTEHEEQRGIVHRAGRQLLLAAFSFKVISESL